MKFPYNLSKDRLSLLSKEDIELYEYEHSIFYSASLREKALSDYYSIKNQRNTYYLNMINEDEEYNEMTDLEKSEMSLKLTEIEAISILEDVIDLIGLDLTDDLSAEDIEDVKKYSIDLLLKNTNTQDTANAINELGNAPGHDMTYWMGDMGWLGNLAMGIIGTGLAGMVGLIMAGYDKRAAKNLEKYMNKMVELTDEGLHKKKSFFSFFGLGKNKGDQSLACFRSALEFVERNMAKNAMVLGKTCGLLSGDGLSDALSNTCDNGGLFSDMPGTFKTTVMDKINVLISKE